MSQRITYKQIFNASSNGMVVTDRQGTIVHMNRQAEQILGFSAEQHAGTFISDMLPLSGPQIMECLETGRPKLGHPIIGKQVDLVLNISLIRRGGTLLGAVCDFQEMAQFESSARKLESYRRLNQQLEAVFKASSDGLWVCDRHGKVISINEASERLNGIRARDVIGRNMENLVRKGLFDRSVTVEVLNTGRQVTVMQYIGRTGRFLLSTGTPAFDDDGSIFLVVVNERDITELNAIREELEQSHMVTQKIKDELAELSMRELKNEEMVAESKEMRRVLTACLKLARIEASNVLLLGESGTGKGLLAKFIHNHSARSKNPFIQVNCAALPEGLLEAELFGYEKGAFTGASAQGKVGLFELAHQGTLFLDEIGDLPLGLQAKLLKYLDDHEVLRLGGVTSKTIDCVIVAATNQDLETLVERRRFRGDLYYRLNTFTIRIPPLRSRPEDVFELVNVFLARYNNEYGQQKRIRSDGLATLQAYDFPGNVRELKSILKKAVVMSDRDALDEFIGGSLTLPEERSGRADRDAGSVRSLEEELMAVERRLLEEALRSCRSTRELARALGTSQPTVVRKLKKHGLSVARRLSHK